MSSEGFYDEPYGQSEREDYAVSLKKLREEIQSSKTRTAFKRMKLFPDGYLTKDAFEDSEIIDIRFYSKLMICLRNKHATFIANFQVLACIEPSDWQTIKAATDLGAATSTSESIIDHAWAFLKIQIKNKTAAQPIPIIGFVGCKT